MMYAAGTLRCVVPTHLKKKMVRNTSAVSSSGVAEFGNTVNALPSHQTELTAIPELGDAGARDGRSL